MKALVSNMEEKLILVEEGDWLANKNAFLDLKSSVTVSDKVISHHYFYPNLILIKSFLPLFSGN